jgi:hypothetical protein
MTTRHMKKGMTFEQHVETGKMLKRMRPDILALTSKIYRSYPTHTSRHGKQCIKALAQMQAGIEQLKSSLDELLYLDCGPDKFSTHIYYGDARAEK